MTNEITAVIIAKNEEELIGKAIDSIINEVDKVIVLDTGSVDETINICHNFDKVKVVNYQWDDDFSKARNALIDLVETPWMFQLNADEEFFYSSETSPKLKEFTGHNSKWNKEKKPYYYSAGCLNGQLFEYSPRLVNLQHVPGYQYVNPVCEELININNPDVVEFEVSNKIFYLLNNRSKESSLASKKERLIYISSLLYKAIKSNPVKKYYYCFHLANVNVALGLNNIAKDNFSDCLFLLRSQVFIDKEKGRAFYCKLLQTYLRFMLVNYKYDKRTIEIMALMQAEFPNNWMVKQLQKTFDNN